MWQNPCQRPPRVGPEMDAKKEVSRERRDNCPGDKRQLLGTKVVAKVSRVFL